MTRAVQITPARWDVERGDSKFVIAFVVANDTTPGALGSWWVNPRTTTHKPSRGRYTTAQEAVKKCGWLKVDEWVPLSG